MQAITDWLTGVLGSPEFSTLLLTTFASAVFAFVGWLGYLVRRNILRNLSATDFALLRSIATIAVQYTEQKFTDLDGPAKLTAALQVADTYIAAYGLKVTAAQLLNIIEAAVYAETIKMTLPEPTTQPE